MSLAYALMAGAGASAFATPSPALDKQGGAIIVFGWAALSLLGGLVGVVGAISRRALLDVMGALSCASACLVWAAAIVLQAFAARSSGSVTAICIVFAVMALFVRRWVDLTGPPAE